MSREDAHKLLGGYATGTLTPEERQALFAAAMEDQELFSALAKEQALHDLLEDPAARAHLLTALDNRPLPWYRRMPQWSVAALATAAIVSAVFVWRLEQRPDRVQESAQLMRPAPALEPTLPPAVSNSQSATKPAAPPEVRQDQLAEKRRALVDERAQPKTMSPPVAESATKAKVAEAAKDLAKELDRVDAVGRRVVTSGAAAPPPPPPAVISPPSVKSEKADAAAGVQFTSQTGAVNGGVVGGILPQSSLQQGVQGSQQPALQLTPGVQQQGQQAQPSLGFLPVGPVQELRDAELASAKKQPLPLSASAKILRKQADGSAVETQPQELRVGDNIVLQFTPTGNGYLTLEDSAGATPVVDAHLEANKAFDTPPFTLSLPGLRQFTATVSAQPLARNKPQDQAMVQAEALSAGGGSAGAAGGGGGGRGGKGGGALFGSVDNRLAKTATPPAASPAAAPALARSSAAAPAVTVRIVINYK